MIKLIKQPKGSKVCGQCVSAMIAGVSYEDMADIYGHTTTSNISEAKRALYKLGFDAGETVQVDNRKKNWRIPETAFVRIKYGRRRCGHFVAKIQGKFYDPRGMVFDNLDEMIDFYNTKFPHVRTLVSHYFEVSNNNDMSEACGELWYI